MNTYSEYKELQLKQNKIVSELSDKLNKYHKGEFGMVTESIRFSDEFKEIEKQYANEFKRLQSINILGQSLFKKQIKKERDEKRLQRYTF